MNACSAVVHVGPVTGAKFTEYTAEFEAGGELGDTPAQRFVFVLEGSLEIEVDGRRSELEAKGYAYVPQGLRHRVVASKTSRAAVVEKPYQTLAAVDSPRTMVSTETAVSSHPLNDDPDLEV